jgi:hypothetical protein
MLSHFVPLVNRSSIRNPNSGVSGKFSTLFRRGSKTKKKRVINPEAEFAAVLFFSK